MPKISLWKNEKHTNDYKFFDRQISEVFARGGTDSYVHKYLGPADTGPSTDPTQPQYTNPTEQKIQDLLFLENRDRVYDSSIYRMRCSYNVQDLDFDLSQFGLFLQNDTLFITFHLTDMVNTLGRKLIAGDVLELPHLKEFYSLDETIPVALKRFYVIQEGTRSAEGYSNTWWPHLWRVKCGPLVDSREFKQILDLPAADGSNISIRDTLSTRSKDIINNLAIIEEAENNVPLSGYATQNIWIPPQSVNNDIAAPLDPLDSPVQITSGYLVGDGQPPNNFPITGSGTSFPNNPTVGDFYLRIDFFPNRIFRFDGVRWIAVEDAVRTPLTPGTGKTQRDTFINNTFSFHDSQGNVVPSKQSISSFMKPKE